MEENEMANKVQLSEAAISALFTATSSTQGASLAGGWHPLVVQELREAGMVGPQGGLTRAGSIRRQRELEVLEEKAFG